MTRLFRLPALAVPTKARAVRASAMALTLALASGAVLPAVAFAQPAPSDQTAPAAAPTDPSAAPAAPAPTDSSAAPAPATTDPAAAPSAPSADATAPAAAPSDAVTATPEAPAPQGNPYGLGALWANGDIIARGVLIIMVIMSAGTWIIMVMKFLEQGRVFSAAKEASNQFWTKTSVHDGAASLKAASPFRYIAETGIVAAEHHEGSMRDAIDLHSWTEMSIGRAVDTINTRLQGGLAFLGTVGSTSPFVGLFGTVWGIYHALTAIGIAGQASIDKVAGPVGESLIMTAIGLATAVPAVLGYNLLVRRNKGAMDRVRNFAADVQSVLIGGFRHGVSPEAARMETPTTITTSQRV
ncbi:MotA/TolQ/ExbB proton channel family protein [Gluconobacter wancherniae]|nr:MotA/TolQ/ExbB proton channel family protein [Gluconobacter wancherniae]MBF0854349.1 MotA/TolQ/ExbB proton channel family protein [Gluconobacter wancherniae]MBS1062745.1 MotA/TolQ/ExbB proton channel family protein [Gluconobacter wancherniae]MBS1088519.1 MotA/TolQ/ExbB proton channel family protein [Gluconobacter wancherniae]MBS1094880.1 MotA/TolQ/ExbB proton channel family protein [Gluconobacter wancherniae]GBD57410.1 biopolymer transporter ExbB [Gluconobacter wancherniae NBRC 103581]